MKSLAAKLCVLALVLTGTTPSSAGVVLTVSTDQTGGNTQVDVEHTSLWNFTIGTGISFEDIVGSFVLKPGNKVSESITFSLWSGFDMAGSLLAWDAKSPLDFQDSKGKVDQQYMPYEFTLDNVNIGPGQYSLSLTSPAADKGSDQYFIKGNADQLQFDKLLVDLSSTPVIPTPMPPVPPIQDPDPTLQTPVPTALDPVAAALVPEPTSLALAGFAGLGMLGASIRRRRAAKAAAV